TRPEGGAGVRGDALKEVAQFEWKHELRAFRRSERLERLQVLDPHRLVVDVAGGLEDGCEREGETLGAQRGCLALAFGLEDVGLFLTFGLEDRGLFVTFGARYRGLLVALGFGDERPSGA